MEARFNPSTAIHAPIIGWAPRPRTREVVHYVDLPGLMPDVNLSFSRKREDQRLRTCASYPMMKLGWLLSKSRWPKHNYVANPRLRRLSFAAASVLCLLVSMSLLYSVALLHFAAGSWALLQMPSFDPRPARNSDEIALMLFQIIGGVSLAISCRPGQSIRRGLKWWPLFIIGFAALTWILALAASPWRLVSNG